jgi:peptide chain release factor subunit 1
MDYIEIWKTKKLIKKLNDAKGTGTSVISLIISSGSQISMTNKLLTEEYGKTSNIKSHVNKLSVQEAITSTQHRVKMYSKTPPNGLFIFCGNVQTDDGKEKKITISFEPIKPVNTTLYRCDSIFHTEALNYLLESNELFGFIIFNGDSCLYATLQGNIKTVLHQFSVDLPKKHSKGGQSAQRFGRLRLMARHHYLKKVAELATKYFITNNNCNVKALVLGGSADFKDTLLMSDLFDKKLKEKVISVVDISYGGISGLNQAIQLSQETFGNLQFIEEKKIINSFFNEISKSTNKYCFTIKDTMIALELGAIETLIIWDNFNKECKLAIDKDTKVENIFFTDIPDNFTFKENILFLDWITNNYTNYGAKLFLISDNSSEGTQFIKGFSGVGGLLRWEVNFEEMEGNNIYEDLDNNDIDYEDENNDIYETIDYF